MKKLVFVFIFILFAIVLILNTNKTAAAAERLIFIHDQNLVFPLNTSAQFVYQLLQEKKIQLGPEDKIYPSLDGALPFAAHVFIQRATFVNLSLDGENKKILTFATSVEKFLQEQEISFTEEDLVFPGKNEILSNNSNIKVTKVTKKEIVKNKEIPAPLKKIGEKNLAWGEIKVKEKGETGLKEEKWQITYHDGKEIKRKLLAEKIIKEPKPHLEIHGTKISLTSAKTGLASWYRGGFVAAHPYFPLGTSLKVTNLINRQSTIVKVVDRGPFANGRIVDLGKKAFGAIASLNTGVIPVKVEKIN